MRVILVIEVRGRGDVLGHDAGAEPCRRAARDPAVEDELDLFRAAEIEVLPDYLLEEQATMHRSIEHLSGRKLGLQDGERIAVAGFAVCGGERVRQQA